MNTLPGTAKAVLDEATSSADPTLEARPAPPAASSKPSSAATCPRRSPARCTATTRRGARGSRSPSEWPRSCGSGDVLDVGSGDGAAAAYLAPYCRSLVCIDTSPRMIDAARERLAVVSSRPRAGGRRARAPVSRVVVRFGHRLSHADVRRASAARPRRVRSRPASGRAARDPFARQARAGRTSRPRTASATGLLSPHPPHPSLARRARRHLLRRRLPGEPRSRTSRSCLQSPRSPRPSQEREA